MPETECLVSLPPKKNPLHLQTSSFSGGNSIMPVTESKIFGITSDPSLSYLITNPSAILSGQLSVGIQNLTTSLHLCQCHGLSFHHVSPGLSRCTSWSLLSPLQSTLNTAAKQELVKCQTPSLLYSMPSNNIPFQFFSTFKNCDKNVRNTKFTILSIFECTVQWY